MSKTAGKGGKNDGEKASKGLGQSKKINTAERCYLWKLCLATRLLPLIIPSIV